jgi:hypothetical protein
LTKKTINDCETAALTIIPLSIFENRNNHGNREIMRGNIIDYLDSNEK